MKLMIRKLRGGGALTIFPEGTRTRDGRLGEVKSGFALVAKRAGVPILPVAIVGAWECWPRTRWFPRPGRIRLEFGALIQAGEVAGMDDKILVALVTRQLTELDAAARRLRDGGDDVPSPRRAALTAAKSAERRRATDSPREAKAGLPSAAPPLPAAAEQPLPEPAGTAGGPSPPPPPA